MDTHRIAQLRTGNGRDFDLKDVAIDEQIAQIGKELKQPEIFLVGIGHLLHSTPLARGMIILPLYSPNVFPKF